MRRYESTPLDRAPYEPLINYELLSKPKRQPISKRKVAGWMFYIALNVALVYAIYEGFVMRGAI